LEDCLPLVYRAVSDIEYQQIVRTGTFEIVPAGCEGKRFADTIEGARRFGKLLYGEGAFWIVEAETPKFAASLHCWTNLDGCGSARFLHFDDLKDVQPRLCESESGT